MTSTTSTLDPWPIVKRGARNHPVRTLQRLLDHHGQPIEVDGVFGPLTEGAVRSVQRRMGVEVDGVVGPVTWSVIVVTVRRGSRGDAVKAVQEEATGGPRGELEIDGIFGPTTEAWVRDFQAALSAFDVVVDGVVGPVTWRALVSGMVSD